MRSPILARLLISLLCAAALAWSTHRVQRELGQTRDLHRASYVGSAECRRCHADHTASWRRTFHRTMTQAADDTSVRGDFSGQSLDYFGVRAHMERDENGAFVVRYAGGPGEPERRFVVEKTVGSRRYQQYIARRGSELVRLPVAYHLEEQRWFHMNGAFLTPDPELIEGALAQADFERHVTRWNDNCVFCHNVAPNPGKRGDSFETQVAELGIGCEACHGPGSEHARLNRNPLRRFALHLTGRRDPTIVNPAHLSPARAADVCGRCHGQRITDRIEVMLAAGDPFVPGEDLALYSAPLWRDTTLHGESGVFAPRFWPDGTPRLTAYEYQGLLLSPCHQRGALTCTDCHGMHEGDPRGQVRPAREGAAMCTQCHNAYESRAAQVAHARHGEQPPECVDCHMPPVVYGVLSTHPSHRIEAPDPARAAEHGRPDACTLCHVDRSRTWAAEERAKLFATPAQELAATVANAPEADAEGTESDHDAPSAADEAHSEVEKQLFAGDPIERALAARALGRGALPPARRAWARGLLLEAMEHDPYPVVRRFAARSLGDLEPALRPQLEAFVPEVPLSARARFVAALRERVTYEPPPGETLNLWRAEARTQAIEIGE